MTMAGPAAAIRVLGPLEVEVQGRVVALAPKLRTLLALLAVRRGGWVSSATLIEELWPGDTSPATAAKTLQGNILRLRRTFGPDAIETRRERYALSLDVVATDAQALEDAARRVEARRAAGDVEGAIAAAIDGAALWRGRPYDDVDDVGVLDAERTRLAEARHRLLEFSFGAQIDRGHGRLVVAELEGIVAADPLREEFWVLLIRALHASGRTVDALAAYGRARRVLATELGIEPGPAMRSMEAVLVGGAVEPSAMATGFDGSRPMRRAADRGRPATPSDPFVGRADELALGRSLFAAARQGERRTLVVQGTAGIGKTRLLREMVAALRVDDRVVVLEVRNEAIVRRAYGPIADLVAQVVHADPGAIGQLDDTLAMRVQRLREPGPLAGAEAARPAPTSNPQLERRLTAEAVSRALTSFALAHGPVVLAVEDIQWADVGTLDVLLEIATAPLPAPIFLLLTHRNDQRRPEVADALRELDRSGRSRRSLIDVLPPVELRELIARLVGADRVNDGVVAEIIARTDGNTLLARELARSVSSGSAELPETVRDLVDANLARCSRAAVMLVELGSLLGRSFDPSFAMAIVDKQLTDANEGARTADEVVAELCAADVLTMTSDAAMFVHDLFRDAVIARLIMPDRRSRHVAIVAELEARLSDDLDALVHHSVESGVASKAALRLSQRARRLLRSGLVANAIADGEAALEWFARDLDHALADELDAGLVLTDARGLGLDNERAEQELRAIITKAVNLDGSDRRRIVAGAHRRITKIRLSERRSEEAAADLHVAVQQVGETEPSDPELVDEWIEVWTEAANIDYFTLHATPWAIGAMDRIEAAVDRVGTTRQIAMVARNRTLAMHLDARFTGPLETLPMLRRQRAAGIELGDLPLIADATFALGFTHLGRLDGRSAAPFFDEAAERLERIGDRFSHALAVAYAATCRRLTGDVDGAKERSLAALPFVRALPMPNYLAVVESNLVWCALRRAEQAGLSSAHLSDEGRAHLSSMLDHLGHPTVVGYYPFVGFMLWPAMSVAHGEARHEAVRALANDLIRPSNQRLPERIEAIVRDLVVSPDDPSIDEACAWARSVNFL